MSVGEQIQQLLQQGQVAGARYVAQEYLAEQASMARLDEIGLAAKACLQQLVAPHAERFLTWEWPGMTEPMLQAMRRASEPDLEATRNWRTRLGDLAVERHSNAIVEKVKARDTQGAMASVKGLLAAATTPEHAAVLARKVGNILGGLTFEVERARALAVDVAKNAEALGLPASASVVLLQEFDAANAGAARRERTNASASRTELTQATVELSRALPMRNVMAEAAPEDVERFRCELAALLRVAMESEGGDYFYDVTMLLVEFSPKAVSATGALAGVEARLYSSLGRTARTISAAVLAELGQLPALTSVFLPFAKNHLNETVGRYAIELMGMLRNDAYLGLLLEALKGKHATNRVEAIFSLGSLAHPSATQALLATLKQDLSGRVLQGEVLREAETLVNALARTLRASDATTRSQIIAQVIQLMPANDMAMQVRVALNYFVGKVEELDPRLVHWAARVATIALWQERPEIKQARNSPLGYRQPLVDLLQRLAPVALPTVNATALELAKIYSGAYLALGEMYANLKDESALAVIQQLLFNAYLSGGDGAKSAYQKEMIFDPVSNQEVPLTLDKVLASLVYAIDQIGGDTADDMLDEMFDRVQLGRIPPPGQETATILMNAHARRARARGESQFARMDAAVQGGAGAGTTSAPSVGVTLTAEDEQFIKDLKASYLLQAKRRAKMVAALAGLSSRLPLAAMDAVVEHLDDKDPMVAGAAMTTLVDYATSRVTAGARDVVAARMCDALKSAPNSRKVKIGEAFTRAVPSREPFRTKLEELGNDLIDAPTRAVIMQLMSRAAAQAAPAAASQPSSGGATDSGNGDTPPSGAAPANKNLSALDKKRQYMLARQAWIKGGKRGPEPVPPE